MPITDSSMYRTRDDILAEMLAELVAAIPDAYVGEDGVTRIVFEIDAGQMENLYLAHQLLLEDSFITTASAAALQRYGDDFGVAMGMGTQSTGTLTFDGAGGTYIPVGTSVGYDPGSGLDEMFFITTTDATTLNPGNPVAPTVAVNVTAGNLNGVYEYVVTFVAGSGAPGPFTVTGETLPSPDSAAISPVNQQASLTAIPLGGPGTIFRRIYRQKSGSGIYRQIAEIQDNTTTTFTDNVTDAVMNAGALAPTIDTSHQVTVYGQSEEMGIQNNVGIGTITELVNAPASLVSVTNLTAFTGATDPQDSEDFRQVLLQYLRAPGTGSPSDLQVWAESVPGVDSASVFSNTPAAGSVTVRISGPGGTVPSTGVISDVQTLLNGLDLANITVIVTTFNPVATNVTVDVTTSGTYTLSDVTASVTQAISDYITGLPVGGTLRISGIVDSVFGLAGIDDVVVTVPASNQTTAATDKRTPGIISVI